MGIRIRDNNNIPKALQNIAKINAKKAKVGYITGADYAGGQITHKGKARVHEYGVDIPVTDKMRGFFLAKFGVRLKDSTTHIRIPERSFIRTGFLRGIDPTVRKTEQLIVDAILGRITADTLYELVAMEMKLKIQEQARDLMSPPNAPLTVQNKGFDNPLIETGGMIEAMEVIVE